MKHIILKQSSCVQFLFFILLILDSFVPNRDWSRSDSSKTDSSTDKVDQISSTFLTKNRFPNSFNFLSRSRRKFSADSSKLLLQPKILLFVKNPTFRFSFPAKDFNVNEKSDRFDVPKKFPQNSMTSASLQGLGFESSKRNSGSLLSNCFRFDPSRRSTNPLIH